jgi:hypothetical protein
MSKQDKLLKRLFTRPKDFTFDELKTLLCNMGYSELKLGKTSGSRVAFYSESTERVIRLHKPHPGNILKRYQIDEIIQVLEEKL